LQKRGEGGIGEAHLLSLREVITFTFILFSMKGRRGGRRGKKGENN
jgi:hypothetical protein